MLHAHAGCGRHGAQPLLCLPRRFRSTQLRRRRRPADGLRFPRAGARQSLDQSVRYRRPAIAGQTDADILRYVRADNYHDANGAPALLGRLAHPPAGWDINGNGVWSGYRPDVYFRFDRAGYDLGPDGGRTGWRAYGYIPLPGAFWPANGSADNVAIRLPAAFRERQDGTTDWTVYETNLAIVEALVKRADVPLPPTDERSLGSISIATVRSRPRGASPLPSTRATGST